MSFLTDQVKLRKPAAAAAGSETAEKPTPAQREEPAKPVMHATLGKAARASISYDGMGPAHTKAKQEALQARDKALEDAAMYADLRPDAIQHADKSKEAWAKTAGKLESVKEEHQGWRQEHKLASWLHDKGVWKSGALTQHEDREKRHTEREATAYDAHNAARDEVQRLDTGLMKSQVAARTGWQRLSVLEKQEHRQSTGGGSRGPEQQAPKEGRGYQNHDAITHTAGTAALAGCKLDTEDAPHVKAKADRYTGELVNHGPAPYQNNPDNNDSYFVTLRNDGKDITHWGKDLGSAMNESGAKPGDHIQLQRTGQDHAVEVKEVVRNDRGQVVGTQEIQAVRHGWSVNNLSQQPEHSPQPARTLSAQVQQQQPEPPKPSQSQPAQEVKPEAPKPQQRTLSAQVQANHERSLARRSPFAGMDAPEANQPAPDLHPEVAGTKRRMRP